MWEIYEELPNLRSSAMVSRINFKTESAYSIGSSMYMCTVKVSCLYTKAEHVLTNDKYRAQLVYIGACYLCYLC